MAKKFLPYVVLLAIFQHISWGIGLLLDGSAIGVSGIAWLYGFLPSRCGLAAVLIAVGLGAAYGLLLGQKSKLGLGFLCIQQAMLFVSAVGIIIEVVRGSYADGTVRSAMFIFTDQCPTFFCCWLHALAIYKTRLEGYRH